MNYLRFRGLLVWNSQISQLCLSHVYLKQFCRISSGEYTVQVPGICPSYACYPFIFIFTFFFSYIGSQTFYVEVNCTSCIHFSVLCWKFHGSIEPVSVEMVHRYLCGIQHLCNQFKNYSVGVSSRYIKAISSKWAKIGNHRQYIYRMCVITEFCCSPVGFFGGLYSLKMMCHLNFAVDSSADRNWLGM
jgi:hypothetical protein